jgi:hypothetical protein
MFSKEEIILYSSHLAKSTPSPVAALRGPHKQMQCTVAPKWHQLESSSMLLPHYKSMKSIYQTLNSLAE